MSPVRRKGGRLRGQWQIERLGNRGRVSWRWEDDAAVLAVVVGGEVV